MPELSDKQLQARKPHPLREPHRRTIVPGLPDYAELHALSNFSFQRGASNPEELVERAYQLGYRALAITDESSVAGVVRAHVGLRDHLEALVEYERTHPDEAPLPRNPGFRVLFGSEFDFGRFRLVVIAHDLEGWGNLCEFITAARNTAAPKGEYRVDWATSEVASLQHCEVLFVPRRVPGEAMDLAAAGADVASAFELFGAHLWIAVELLNHLDDDLWLASLQQLAGQAGVPLVAAGDVHMHKRSRKPLQDVVTAIREGKPVAECGFALQANAERHLRSRMRLADLYPPDLLANTLVVMERCRFDLDLIREHYKYPLENVGGGETPTQTLVRKTWEGARVRYPNGMEDKIRRQIQRELDLIVELKYEMFFLTVEDIVRFARERHILCQGRGSSANSAVCYCLGITAINPETGNLLFERFLSRERREPPDIDVDFEHQRREEVIQYIYEKYGRDRAAIAAVVICWRTRSALRDVGKALAIDDRLIEAFAKDHHWFDHDVQDERIEQAMRTAGVRESTLKLRQWLELTQQLKGFPRHLSQHVGGFVLTHSKLTRLVPVEKASMKDRSVIQWEKDDLEAMGMLKVDVLALGMLSAIRRALDFVNQWRGTALEMHQIPNDDAKVYDMICEADTIGVFQIESRAQMSMLPRLKPRCYYDLVIEVAIVRPGPIQGGMVHPYLKRRQDPKLVDYPKGLHEALGRTLGVPIFQEQVMQIAMIAAEFTPDEADKLRRSMAAWKRKGGVGHFYDRLVNGMVERGYDRSFAEAIFKQIQGFGEYGFPESHAASFALLVVASCWLKHYEPACFLAAMLDSQPMGFYSPSQLVQDARRHGVEVRPVDVTVSDNDCTLESPLPLPRTGEGRGEGDPPSPLPARGKGQSLPLPRTGEGRGEGDSPSPFPACGKGQSLPLPRAGEGRGEGDPPSPLPACGKGQSLPLPRAGEGRGEGRANPHPPAVRLGLRRIVGLSEAGAKRLLEARDQSPFTSTEDLALRAELDARDMAALAGADALISLSGHRRQQVWDATAQRRSPALLKGVPIHETPLQLPAAPEGEEIVGDYASLRLTLRRHPLELLRPRLARMKLLSAKQLHDLPNGRTVRACGIVMGRQRPQTANGTIFVTLEDETGNVNVIVWSSIVEAWRGPLLQSHLLAVQGTWQRDVDSGGKVCHVVATGFRDLTPLMGRLAANHTSRDFH